MTPDELKEKITVSELCSRLYQGTAPRPGKVMKCVFHADKTPSLSISRNDRSFKCFGCQASGSVIDFMAYSMGLDNSQSSFIPAARALAELLGSELDGSKEYIPNLPQTRLTIDIQKDRAGHDITEDPSEPYLEWAMKKGISSRIVNRMVQEGSLHFLGGIPHYRYRTGVKVRYDMTSSSSSRWQEGGPHSIWRFKRVLSWDVEAVWMTEGESDCMLTQELVSDKIAVVALPNATYEMSSAEARAIGGRPVVTMFDNDKAGIAATERIHKALKGITEPVAMPWVAGDPKDLCLLGRAGLLEKIRIINKL